MQLRAVLCVPLGHRWTTDSESFDTQPLVHGTRCGRRRHTGAQTRDVTPWTGCTPSSTGRMSGGTGRDGRPY